MISLGTYVQPQHMKFQISSNQIKQNSIMIIKLHIIILDDFTLKRVLTIYPFLKNVCTFSCIILLR